MKIVKLFAVGLLLGDAFFSTANAQTNSYRTNVLMNITFNLTAYEQDYLFLSTSNFDGPYVPSAKISKIATDGVIRAVAHQAHIIGDLNDAKLYFRSSWTDPHDISYDIVLRSPTGQIMGTNDAVINRYLSLNFPNAVLATRASLNGTTNATE